MRPLRSSLYREIIKKDERGYIHLDCLSDGNHEVRPLKYNIYKLVEMRHIRGAPCAPIGAWTLKVEVNGERQWADVWYSSGAIRAVNGNIGDFVISTDSQPDDLAKAIRRVLNVW